MVNGHQNSGDKLSVGIVSHSCIGPTECLSLLRAIKSQSECISIAEIH